MGCEGITRAQVSSIKSTLPDQPVPITGVPSAMASAMVRPKPSARCSEMSTSAEAIRLFTWA